MDQPSLLNEQNLTHDLLVHIAFQWLCRKKCSVVVSEMTSSGGEQPDVIGWKRTCSYLIEVKVSASDFLADQKKYWRQPGIEAMGRLRYYIVPLELQDYVLERLPAKWGLLVPRKERVFVVREPVPFERVSHSETAALISIIRRIAKSNDPFQGVSINCYTHEWGSPAPRAVLSVCPETEDGGRYVDQ